MLPLDQLRFARRFVDELPGDPRTDARVREVVGACFSRVTPTPVRAPELVAVVPEVAALLELSPAPTPALAAALAGNAVVPGMVPYAACYGGHQFGTWAGQLGDGRAITLGEVVTSRGHTWELQLKGAGPTPYARRGDGRAVLRSSLRELVCSEAMFHLGVPTTRALSLALTGEQVERDLLYDGHPALEPGAVVCRVARSFLRFGSFELHAARGDHATLRALTRHAIAHHYPRYLDGDALDVPGFFAEVARRTAWLVTEWLRVGFVHGVMNTDNMSILGLTLDYGPYGWLEVFDPDWTPNLTDAHGRRYRFGHVVRTSELTRSRRRSPLRPRMEMAMELKRLVTLTFDKNVGTGDRIFRLASGLALAIGPWLVALPLAASLPLSVLGAMWMLTGLLSKCSIYYLLGYSTGPVSAQTLPGRAR